MIPDAKKSGGCGGSLPFVCLVYLCTCSMALPSCMASMIA